MDVERKPKKKSKKTGKCVKSGQGIIDKIIDKIPFEMHVPSYQYCGPGNYKSIFFYFLEKKKKNSS